MRRYTKRSSAMSVLAVSALLVGGPMVAAPSSGLTAGASAPVASAQASSVPSGLRRAGHEGVKARMFWTFGFGPFISVDVNPTLPGGQSYKVKLQVKRDGEWVKCAVKRTHNAEQPFLGSLVRGRRPHEMTTFVPGPDCPGKATKASQYRIVLKAQHGFDRTVSQVLLSKTIS